ncbi:MAG: imidazoleglycerol-phosphate dehydratase HisB [Candidatus Latescibacteria bacterium]|nr:imidazoleglycerol-phosphate dehydratase HisB [Candidatus Latescibacterota bacterium]
MKPRSATIHRKTSETDVTLSLTLDGTGVYRVQTGVGFFDHMLSAFARHGLFDLEVACKGDLHVDAHHTVEDVGICLGQALGQALGDKAGITRFGSSYVPMDEALARVAVDLSGRAYLVCNASFAEERIGDFPAALTQEFFRALSDNARANVHLDLIRCGNAHHGVEALFKALGRALSQACAIDPRIQGPLSTKGSL